MQESSNVEQEHCNGQQEISPLVTKLIARMPLIAEAEMPAEVREVLMQRISDAKMGCNSCEWPHMTVLFLDAINFAVISHGRVWFGSGNFFSQGGFAIVYYLWSSWNDMTSAILLTDCFLEPPFPDMVLKVQLDSGRGNAMCEANILLDLLQCRVGVPLGYRMNFPYLIDVCEIHKDIKTKTIVENNTNKRVLSRRRVPIRATVLQPLRKRQSRPTVKQCIHNDALRKLCHSKQNENPVAILMTYQGLPLRYIGELMRRYESAVVSPAFYANVEKAIRCMIVEKCGIDVTDRHAGNYTVWPVPHYVTVKTEHGREETLFTFPLSLIDFNVPSLNNRLLDRPNVERIVKAYIIKRPAHVEETRNRKNVRCAMHTEDNKCSVSYWL